MGPFVLTIDGDDMGTTLVEENGLGRVGVWRELGTIVKFCLSPWPNNRTLDPIPSLAYLLCPALR